MLIIQGDALQELRKLEANSIALCITSPPYWGLRSYGAGEAELGQEPTMEKYLDNMILWVKEVYRVLKPSGSFVLNLGDCFIGGGRGGGHADGYVSGHVGTASAPDWKKLKSQGTTDWKARNSPTSVARGNLGGIYKTKQLLSVSSFAYCRIVSETDFVCRGEHVWLKPNVPSPIRSRLKHSHEKLFWFVKDADDYYFDEKPWLKKVQMPGPQVRNGKIPAAFAESIGLSKSSCFRPPAGSFHAYVEETIEHSWRIVPVGAKQNGFEMEDKKPQSEHVAPYPEALISPYIRSLCPPDGLILDPFLGSGTTMQVARTNHRDCIGIELNPKSIEYAKKRLCWGNTLTSPQPKAKGDQGDR